MKELIKSLNELALKDKKSLLKTVSYTFKPTEDISVKINSFRINEFAFNKQQLPISARGLFINEEDEILIRGYDKFFNIGETDLSSYSWLRVNTRGPYEITVKENGCIIFVASVKGHLLVTSKHAIEGTHALKGNEWLLKHLDSANQTKEAFSNYLSDNNYTAVFELADDDFEEHVLEYSKENSGLYLHGLNKNTPELISEPMSVVHDTCKRFGFHKVECLYRDTIELVQDFASGISSKGFYNGKPIEGFVVRCHRTDLNPNRIHFFKIKFERPYLMFREWREITKALLSKNPRNPRYRYELSKQYIDWVRIKVRTQPHLFQDFLKGKGIILVRNMFLKQVMELDTFADTDLNALCAESVYTEDDQLGKGKSLILPIGTIGIGKTTLGRTLLNLFPDKVFHVQNDNITQKRASHIFESQILDSFQTYDIVYADRNNHLFPMRKSVCEAFKKVYPKGIIYALDWGVDSIDKKSLLDLTIQRVEKRGENHQSLTPGRNKNYHKVLSGFIYHRDPITLNNPADSLIDYVIKFNINSTVSENITILCTHMHLTPPIEINQALEKALDYKETIIKTIQSKPRYYALQIQQNLNTLLTSEFPNADFLKQFPFKDEWHVTVAHRSNGKLIQLYDKRAENILLRGTTVTMKISKVLWNNEIITIPIDSSEPYFESINEHIHVTFAMQEQVNAVKSNDLLREYHKGINVNMVEFKEPKVLTEYEILIEQLDKPLTGDLDFISGNEIIYENGNLGIPQSHLKPLYNYSYNQYKQGNQSKSSLILILINPDNYTVFNYRKSLEIQPQNEVDFIRFLLTKHPNKPLLFTHLHYIYKNYKLNPNQIINICRECCDRYKCNYPAWNLYRMVLPTTQITKEITVNLSFVKSHISDSSGWSFRFYLILQIPSFDIKKEIEMVRDLMMIYPNHESMNLHLKLLTELQDKPGL